MGYLLKEALKALCGVNQWSYAVFWKFGCQNPKLLIWEECYHESLPYSNTPHNSTLGNQGMNMHKMEGYQNGSQVGDPVHLLMDKMMMSNQISMVGEGLVGRAAFTGNHQWIVSGNYNENAYPTEVLNEFHLQFSAGMQTIAVIPVIPHGVVQLGSTLAIMENVGFVHDVKSLILQVGSIPSALVSDNYIMNNASSMYGLPVVDVASMPLNLNGNLMHLNPSSVADSFNLSRNSSQTVGLANHSPNSLLTQFQDSLQVNGSIFTMPNLSQDSCKSLEDHYAAKINAIVDCSAHPLSGLVENKVNGGIVRTSKPDSLINQPGFSNNPAPRMSCTQTSAISRSSTLLKQAIVSHGLPDRISCGSSSTSAPLLDANKMHHATLKRCSNNLKFGNSELVVDMNGQHGQMPAHNNMALHDADTSKELIGIMNTRDQLVNSSSVLGLRNLGNCSRDGQYMVKHVSDDVHEVLNGQSKILENMSSGNFTPDDGSQVPSSKDPVSENAFFQVAAGDDLFDVLGVDLKNKLLNFNDTKLNKFGMTTKDEMKILPRSVNRQNLGFEVYSDYFEGISESGVFSSGSDHLLDAVISGVSSAANQMPEDSMSCWTSVTKISSSSVPGTPHSSPLIPGVVAMPDQMQNHIFGLSKSEGRLGETAGNSIRSASGCGNCSLTSSSYGSQISSWIDQGPSISVSTANSKKPDEVGKSNRKRLKPRENPRPRPKDRQMIQDRVKELREIVPNGAKCSIDALLERTIKHMLFLQSVTKHADKLKQTVESKITNREGGGFVKDNFEGGATWAFELGSKSMVCPIVVEDLNPPRQLLIEMLCEERGFFLEIADIIRGMGLTILKGVMEARNDKVWARFAVEANRDVTRMEVFMSLVHLLEQTLNGSSGSGKGAVDENMVAHPTSMGANQQLVGPIVCGEPSVM